MSVDKNGLFSSFSLICKDNGWVLFLQQMNQILEQIVKKELPHVKEATDLTFENWS